MADGKEDLEISQKRLLELTPRDPKLRVAVDVSNGDEREAHRYIWRSCCMDFDSRAVVFFSQCAITSGIMAFCIYMLATHEDCESRGWYGGLLTFLIGVLLPNPRIGAS